MSVDAARGIAALSVMLFHTVPTDPANVSPTPLALQPVLAPGWLGVHVFFAISGWCIAERIAGAMGRGESALDFLRERVLRIFPLYWAVLGLAILLRLLAAPFNHTGIAANLPPSPSAWLGDLLLIQPYLHTPLYLVVSWSLVYELGFYLLGALGLALLRVQPPIRVTLLGAMLGLWPLLPFHPLAGYVLQLWPEFLAGVAAWLAARGFAGRFVWPLLLSILGAAAGCDPMERLMLAVAVGTAIALWWASSRDQEIAGWPGVAPLAWLGLMSYSLYLTHLSVMSPLFNLALRLLPHQQSVYPGIWLLTLAAAILIGQMVYRLIELPIERWRRQHRKRSAMAGSG